MATQYLNDVLAIAGGYNVSGNANKVALAAEADELDVTTFGSGGAKALIGGHKDVSFDLAGFFEADGVSKPDDAAWANLSVADTPILVAPASTDGGVAYGFLSDELHYAIGGNAGEAMPFDVSAVGRGPGVARGFLIHPAATARTASGTGNYVNLGALSATQRIYASLHVLAVSGTVTPTITVALQRDDNTGFTSPTTVTTFTGATAIGSQSYNALGAATDAYYRVTWTITGTNPSFLFAVLVGVI